MTTKRELGLRPCPRPCVDDVDPETGEKTHHWLEEANGIDCKHCRAGINWTVKCAVCGHELIDHWAGFGDAEEECSLPCGRTDGPEGGPYTDCKCPAFRVRV